MLQGLSAYPDRALGTQVWLVAGDCFFIGLAPVLVHLAKNSAGGYSFHPVAVNLLVEVAKLVFATIVLIANVRSPVCLACPMQSDLTLGCLPSVGLAWSAWGAAQCSAALGRSQHAIWRALWRALRSAVSYSQRAAVKQSGNLLCRAQNHGLQCPEPVKAMAAGDGAARRPDVPQRAVVRARRGAQPAAGGAGRPVRGEQLPQVRDAAVLQADHRQDAQQPEGAPQHTPLSRLRLLYHQLLSDVALLGSLCAPDAPVPEASALLGDLLLLHEHGLWQLVLAVSQQPAVGAQTCCSICLLFAREVDPYTK